MRIKFNTMTEDTYKTAIEELAKETRIPMARLVDEALEDLFKKYGKEVKK